MAPGQGVAQQTIGLLEKLLSDRREEVVVAGQVGDAALAQRVDRGANGIAQDPSRKDALTERLAAMGTKPTNKPRLRVVLTWETDANDVDLHVLPTTTAWVPWAGAWGRCRSSGLMARVVLVLRAGLMCCSRTRRMWIWGW